MDFLFVWIIDDLKIHFDTIMFHSTRREYSAGTTVVPGTTRWML